MSHFASHVFVSLSQKSKWTEVIQALDQAFEPTWVATASTAFYLRDLGSKVKSLEEIGIRAFGLSGKVKSLHPNVYRSILVDRHDEEELNEISDDRLHPMDMVCVDIYRIETGPQFHMEQMDIGGPAALRAACKNFRQCLPVATPDVIMRLLQTFPPQPKESLYPWIQRIPMETRARVAADVLMMMSEVNHTLAYELVSQEIPSAESLSYGDNPIETCWLNPIPAWDRQERVPYLSLDDPAILRNPRTMKFSWNNLMDIHQALSLMQWIDHPFVATIMKHHHPSGVGYSDVSIEAAFQRALDCDPLSAYGGVIVLNSAPSEVFLQTLKGMFVDLLVMPCEPASAFETMVQKKPNLRCLGLPMQKVTRDLFARQRHLTCFGEVVLEKNKSLEMAMDHGRWQVIEGKSDLTSDLVKAAKHANAVAAHLHSNAVVVADPAGTVGLAMGFVNRVKAILHAVKQSKEFKGLGPLVVASDGFMPFADNIEALSDIPVDVVIQPGGSKKDQEVIEACQRRQITLILTGARVFFHGI
jgi:phosphoribosylaminoimidazolecarboxamide formyltransferase/IMP cyclohydrolase